MLCIGSEFVSVLLGCPVQSTVYDSCPHAAQQIPFSWPKFSFIVGYWQEITLCKAMALATRSQTKRVVNYETLANLNNNTSTHAAWLVRIKSPQMMPIAFTSKGERINSHRFQCVLTSANEKEYMFGVVPFDFKNRDAAQEAMRKFVEDSVWEISTPVFNLKAKTEYTSTPF